MGTVTSLTSANHPRWVILNGWGIPKYDVDDDTSFAAAAAAECRTSWGQPLRVTLSAASPPAISFICFDNHDKFDNFCVRVIAAHGDSVLLKMSVPENQHHRHLRFDHSSDYFVYKAAGDQPSLSLLPPCDIPMKKHDQEWYGAKDHVLSVTREFEQDNTGILRDEEDGLLLPLVAQLQISFDPPFDTAEICVLRPGRHREWELNTAVPIVVQHNSGNKRHRLKRWQETDVAVPVGSRFLCWANYDLSTFLLYDMADAIDKLVYVPLPVKPVPPGGIFFFAFGNLRLLPRPRLLQDQLRLQQVIIDNSSQKCTCHRFVHDIPVEEDDDDEEEQLPWLYYRKIGAAGDDTVRFVSIDNRCCCGTPVIRSRCEHSSSAFMVTMWSLALRTTGESPMVWVKEAVLDCEEIWALLAASSKGLPRVYVVCPVVSFENPDVVCFIARSEDIDDDEDGKIWTIEIDMKRKTLMSVAPCPPHPLRHVNYCGHLPAKLYTS
uniref:DUF1618 domain-containing protein n=1 Tax=Leersia perrieri TaxID=77586 RepID=A0A0D9XTB6_9ORYZ